jgi:hypothetical protein
MEMKKIRVVGVILLFIGIAIAPSINTGVVTASQDDDLVEITTQVCGIKGYGNSTVTLTREQYTEVEKLFDDIEVKLKTVKTRGEALPIYNNAIKELNTYGLLPKGMSIEQAQKLVTNGYSKGQRVSIFEEIFHKNSLQEEPNNICCLVAGVAQDGTAMGILGMIGLILMLLNFFPSPFPFLGNPLILLLGGILYTISSIIVTFSPFAVMQQVSIHSGNITSVGLNGITHFNQGSLVGFNGIKVSRISTKEMYLLGFCLMVFYLE